MRSAATKATAVDSRTGGAQVRHQPNPGDRIGSAHLGGGQYAKSSRVYRKPPIARHVYDGACCVNCGWGFKSTSSVMLAGRSAEGEALFKHALCPSLSERRRMRAEALANA